MGIGPSGYWTKWVLDQMGIGPNGLRSNGNKPSDIMVEGSRVKRFNFQTTLNDKSNTCTVNVLWFMVKGQKRSNL